MRSVSVGLGLVLLVAWSSVAFAVEGTVRLKNGGFIQGDVLEVLPGEHVSVRTSDGSVRNIAWDEIDRVDEAQAATPAAPAVPAEPAPEPVPLPPPAPVVVEASEPLATMVIDYDAMAALRYDDVTLTLFGALGLLGNAAYDVEGTLTGATVATVRDSDDADLDLAYGGGAQLDVPAHRYFSLAAQLRLTSWAPKSGDSGRRALFVDATVAPRLRFPFALSAGSFGVGYVQVPLGLGYVDFPDEGDVTVSPALVVGVSAGFMALLSEHLGLSLELGWLHHSFSVDYEETIATASGDVLIASESAWSVNQVLFQLGLVIDF